MRIRIEESFEERAHYDVIVAGGGVAGAAAAVAARRLGKSVLLVEKSMKLGGLATLGLINLYVPMCNGRGKQIIRGMAEEFLELGIRYGYGDLPSDFHDGRIPEEKLREYEAAGKLPPRFMVPFSAEFHALALTELLVNEGVSLMFDSIVSAPVMDPENPGRILGVILENKSGRSFFTAEQFIDTTGDGDLMYRAGVPVKTRGNFHTYIGFGLDMRSLKTALEQQNVQYAHTTAFRGGGATLYGEGHPEEIPLYDGTKDTEVNRYLITNQLEMLSHYKEDDRKSRDIVTLPGMAQFRTTRRIDGRYVLQESDVYRHFEDSVGAINDFDRRDYLFEIPYGTLVADGFPNIMTAGRSAAGEGYAWDVLRVIPPAIITGQAAGIAVSLAIDSGCPISNIDIPSLQAELEKENVLIHFDDADVPPETFSGPEHND